MPLQRENYSPVDQGFKPPLLLEHKPLSLSRASRHGDSLWWHAIELDDLL